jgi:hypothetical protein
MSYFCLGETSFLKKRWPSQDGNIKSRHGIDKDSKSRSPNAVNRTREITPTKSGSTLKGMAASSESCQSHSGKWSNKVKIISVTTVLFNNICFIFA